MLKHIWSSLILASVMYGIIMGKADEMGRAILTAGEDALMLTMTLVAAMTLWNGLLGILGETGDILRLGRVFSRLFGRFFGGLKDEECWEAMSMNIAANILGVGNAATPAGVRAAQLLTRQGECGMRALAALLTLNNAGLQAVPTTVVSLRQTAGSSDPAGIWGIAVIAGCTSAAAGMAALTLLSRRGGRRR